MSGPSIGRNAPCPCGSGKKYKQCCRKQDYAFTEDDDGTVRRTIPMNSEIHSDDLLLGDPSIESAEAEIVQSMKAADVDPALIYAFQQTGMIVSEENQDLVSDDDMALWNQAVREFRGKQGKPIGDDSPELVDAVFCWSCNGLIPTKAKRCPHCEAKVEDMPTRAERESVLEILEGMDPELMNVFQQISEQCETGEEFVDLIMIGPCPVCESEATTHCEDDSEIDSLAIGRCRDCGQLFCPDCEELFATATKAANHECPIWAEMEAEDDALGF